MFDPMHQIETLTCFAKQSLPASKSLLADEATMIPLLPIKTTINEKIIVA